MNPLSKVKVAFYTYPEWAFGSIHNSLAKEFHRHGVLANIIDWNRDFSIDERLAIGKIYDVFITVPGNAISILVETFGVSLDRIIAVAHGRYDILSGIKEGNKFESFKQFAGVSPDLMQFAKSVGIEREMVAVKNGIDFNYFYQKESLNLGIIGYAGAISHFDFSGSKDIKRGFLARELALRTNLLLRPAPSQSYLTMPDYYSQVDCVMVTSTEESCAMPLMEAAASGRLPISTSVGIARDDDYFPGFILPFEEKEFLTEGKELVEKLAKSPNYHRAMCLMAQDYAREHYDWSKVISPWLNLLSNDSPTISSI